MDAHTVVCCKQHQAGCSNKGVTSDLFALCLFLTLIGFSAAQHMFFSVFDYVCVCVSHILHTLAQRLHSPYPKTTNQELILCIPNCSTC